MSLGRRMRRLARSLTRGPRPRAAAIVCAALFVAGGAMLARRARQSVPLRYAEIPEETRRFFRELERGAGDLRVRFDDDPVRDRWRDETNEGEDAGNGFFKLEDADFIVYYHEGGEENAKANLVLGSARRSVGPLASLFGKYFHPADANGRKLAFYLCGDRPECARLSAYDNPRAIAVTLMIMSPTGALCRGIFLHPETFTSAGWRRGDGESYRQVEQTIRHEMAHYVYFSSLDLSRPLGSPQWVTEGVAEYAAGNAERLREVNPARLIPLADFESAELRARWLPDAYWIGYTALLHLERRHSAEGVRSFLRLNYRAPARAAVEQSTGLPFARFDAEWQTAVRSGDF